MADASASKVIVVRSGPGTAAARRALSLLTAHIARGEEPTLVLLGDAVWLAHEASATGARVACIAEDAAMRGLAVAGLRGVRVLSYAELADLLMGEAKVVGAL
jgi:sulfur transfer complex TusBCD TusB component (DsrH family)